MIDPKFNELPDKAKTGSGKLSETDLAEEETPTQTRAPRPGLSVNDTIAADANLSVGGRGVNTSGVSSGAGAGAGSFLRYAWFAGRNARAERGARSNWLRNNPVERFRAGPNA